MIDGTAVRCDCCGLEKLAEIHPCDKLEIRDGRHGRKHVVIMTPLELLQRISGTTNGSAIIRFVQTVVTR